MIFNTDGTVTLSKNEFNELQKDSDMLAAFRAAGVDNWEGYEFAIEHYHQYFRDPDVEEANE